MLSKELPHAGDLEMWFASQQFGVTSVREVPQAFYRVHPKSMMRTVYRGSFFDLQQRRDAFEAFFRHCREYLDEGERLRCLANRTLAREALWDACRSYDRNARCQGSELTSCVWNLLKTCADAKSLPEYARSSSEAAFGAHLLQANTVVRCSGADKEDTKVGFEGTVEEAWGLEDYESFGQLKRLGAKWQCDQRYSIPKKRRNFVTNKIARAKEQAGRRGRQLHNLWRIEGPAGIVSQIRRTAAELISPNDSPMLVRSADVVAADLSRPLPTAILPMMPSSD